MGHRTEHLPSSYRNLGYMRDWTEGDKRWKIHEEAINSGLFLRQVAVARGEIKLICPDAKWFCYVTKE